jgi:3-hydroxyacyl-[acyl-carrier-protein] dehydratase
MLLKEFYSVNSLEKNSEQRFTVLLSINEKHEVFKGHFPENPVMPGVCMMQIIKELTEDILKTPLFMQNLSTVKFMALINPQVNPELKLELDVVETDEGLVKVKNTTYFNDTVALKLSSTYKKV